MTAPLTVEQFIVKSIMPADDLSALDVSEPEFIQEQLDDWWDEICARLAKRYDIAAMAVDPPLVTLRWLAKLVTRECYDKRGNNPSAASDNEAIYRAAERVEAAIKEAADSQNGLYDLPLLASTTSSGVTKGGPLGYAEASPYTSFDLQVDAGRTEDWSRS